MGSEAMAALDCPMTQLLLGYNVDWFYPYIVCHFSFGKVLTIEDKNKISREDLARSALVTTTNNIGSIALNAANQNGIDRIVFVGLF